MEKKYFILPVLLFVVVIGTYLYTKKPTTVEQGINSNDTIQNSGNNTPDEAASDKNSYQNNLSLEIVSPKDGTTVSTSSVNLTGKTNPDADVFINNKQLKADASGNFSSTVSLDEGQNSIIVVVNDNNGNSAEKQVNIILESTQ